jgi:hypothetical protein
MTVYLGVCTNCWWIEPSVLRYQAGSYEWAKRFIIAKREGRVKRKKVGGYIVEYIVEGSKK